MSHPLSSLFVALLLAGSQALPATAGEFDHSHILFARVLQKYVKDGWVNYRSLKSAPADLNAYLDRMASVQESGFQKWSRNQQLAFLTNLYNASTLKLIIEHYPLKSIKDIGNILKGPWDQPVVRLFGQTVTLNHLEHGIVRKKYDEPRAHFALVCAAKGCPPLREEPYVSERLDEQLNDQGKIFLAASQKNSVDVAQKIINLSPIFDWFEKDFTKKSGSLPAFVQPYFPPDQARAILKGSYKIKFTYYDWTLNDSEK